MAEKLILSTISDIILHYVGNKNNGEGVSYSNTKIEIVDDLKKSITVLVYNNFDFNEYYEFYYIPQLKLNPLYNFISNIFNVNSDFVSQSKNCARHLYEQSTHPKIKGGEFYTVYFKDCILDGETLDAIGLFKSENKDTFLKVIRQNGNFNLESQKGINIKKLDKGCLIFNKEQESGYVVAVVDNAGRGTEAQYWINDFLHVRKRKDGYANTQNFMSFTKKFITEKLPKDIEISKADQIELLNKSIQFFKVNDLFNIDDFDNEVMAEPNLIKKFHHYKKEYEEQSDTLIDDKFTISEAARKKQQRVYKRVIHLDKKIQIVIDGNRQNIEQGADKKGKFYKIYYDEEC